MENIQNQAIDPEEKQLEEEALKPLTDDVLRKQVIEKYSLTEDDDSELIDKLVGDKKQEQEKLSKAIGQKIKYRQQATQPPKEEKKELPKEEPKGTQQTDPKVYVKLSKALGEFNEDEIDFIYQFAKDSSPEAIIEASKDEWVKTAITAKREKVAKEKQIPEPGNLPGAETIKGLTQEEITKDPEAHKKAWEKMMKEGKIQGTGV